MFEDENSFFNCKTNSDSNRGEHRPQVDLGTPDPEFLPPFVDVDKASVGGSGDPFGDPPVDPFGDPPVDPFGDPPVDPFGDPPVDPVGDPPVDPFGDPPVDPLREPHGEPLGDLPGVFHAPELRLDHPDLGVQALAGVEAPGPVDAGLKTEKSLYGTGIEAQKLRAVNVRSPEVVAYKKAVENLVGRLHVPKLQGVADSVRDRYHVSVGRVGRRGQWSLWAYFKKQFPDPADFVAFLQ